LGWLGAPGGGAPRDAPGAPRRYLAQLEAGSLAQQHAAAGPQAELPLFTATPLPLDDELHRRLTALEPDELTPRRALELLYELRQLARRLTSGGTEPS